MFLDGSCPTTDEVPGDVHLRAALQRVEQSVNGNADTGSVAVQRPDIESEAEGGISHCGGGGRNASR